mmetsp:Transcript_1970/g.4480  ORF Transcript_1970/g.4480 Transcript_1970/m.4480 type:complete len:254 (-) Transcript_1970:553-1314(-)
MSPTMEMPFSLACRRSFPHCLSKRNWRALNSITPPLWRSEHSTMASGSLSLSAGGHCHQGCPLSSSLPPMQWKSAAGPSQSSLLVQNVSKSSPRLPPLPCATSRCAATDRRGSFTRTANSKSASHPYPEPLLCPPPSPPSLVAWLSSSASSNPSWTKVCSEISKVFPAFAFSPAYGDQNARSGGTKGSTCQHRMPADANQSTKWYASWPRSPHPSGPGRLVGWRTMPARRPRRIRTDDDALDPLDGEDGTWLS